MPDMNLRVFQRLYDNARTCDDLPWHDPEPPALLAAALDARAGPGAALDIGCGAGTYSLYMAQRGYHVTAVDFMPQAIRLLRDRIAETSLAIDPVHADIKSWTTDAGFDVILDVGCLHSLPMSDRTVYRQQVVRWLKPGGDFILVHCGSRGWWDRWPVGPHRVSRADVAALFAPELLLHEYRDERLRLPMLIGCSALASRYWFKRAPQESVPLNR